MTQTNTDKRLSTERLAELVEFYKTVPFRNGMDDDLASALTELIASRTQSPAEWQEISERIASEMSAGKEGRTREWMYDIAKEAAELALRAAPITPPAPERSKEEVRVTPDHAFLHGVCDSLRAAISEYEDRGLYPGARKIMQAQIDALTAYLSVKPGEQG